MWVPWAKPVDPKEQVRKWKTDLRAEGRKLERQVRHIQTEELKVKKSIKDAAKRGDMASAKVLAKELVRSRKVVNRLQISKVQLNSVVMQMQENFAQAKVMGHMQKSAEIMRVMNGLVKLPEIAASMQSLQMEMVKAGVIEDLVDDAMENDESELEDEAEEEVEKVLAEITSDLFEKAGSTPLARVVRARARARVRAPPRRLSTLPC